MSLPNKHIAPAKTKKKHYELPHTTIAKNKQLSYTVANNTTETNVTKRTEKTPKIRRRKKENKNRKKYAPKRPRAGPELPQT